MHGSQVQEDPGRWPPAHTSQGEFLCVFRPADKHNDDVGHREEGRGACNRLGVDVCLLFGECSHDNE